MEPFPTRPRRLRATAAIRRLVAETSLQPSHLIVPVFVADGLAEPRPIASLPGVAQQTIDSVRVVAGRARQAGLGGIMLFGVPRPEDKDAEGTAGYADDGILNRAIRAVRAETGDDLPIFADTCLDEFTDHGHCGVLAGDGTVANDRTVDLYVAQAVSQARAGADFVSPSGMMDGQVGAIRAGLDRAGFPCVGILAYAAKYASAFYGPFREAVASSLQGDRRTYQLDPANRREGRLEAWLDETQGADIVMVKPASHYLDVLADVASACRVPVAAYQVSGEYAMIQAAAERGWIDARAALLESVTCIRRAGADIVLSYAGLDLAEWLR